MKISNKTIVKKAVKKKFASKRCIPRLLFLLSDDPHSCGNLVVHLTHGVLIIADVRVVVRRLVI